MLSLNDSTSLPCTDLLVLEDREDMRAWLVDIGRQVFPQARVTACGTLAQASRWLDAHPDRLTGQTGCLVALVDLGLPDGNGISLVQRLSLSGDHVLPVVTTIFDDDVSLCDAIAAGARGYLLKEHAADVMVGYLRRICQGEPPLSPRIARRILQCMQQRGAQGSRDAVLSGDDARLSPRETEVLGIIGRGLRVNEAAQVLGLTEHTVAGYVKVIYRKLNISSRAEAALEASRRKLV